VPWLTPFQRSQRIVDLVNMTSFPVSAVSLELARKLLASISAAAIKPTSGPPTNLADFLGNLPPSYAHTFAVVATLLRVLQPELTMTTVFTDYSWIARHASRSGKATLTKYVIFRLSMIRVGVFKSRNVHLYTGLRKKLWLAELSELTRRADAGDPDVTRPERGCL